MKTSSWCPKAAAALISGSLVLFHFAGAMPIAAQTAVGDGPAVARIQATIQARVVPAAEIHRGQALVEAMKDAMKAHLPATPGAWWVLRQEEGSVVVELRSADRSVDRSADPTVQLTLAHLGS